jgi:hypothetical protein
MKDPSTPVKTAAFSQYPRGYQRPTSTPAGGNNEENKVVNEENVSRLPLDFDRATHQDAARLDRGGLDNQLKLGASVSDCIKTSGKGCTMGYTMVTKGEDGCEYRYTEWADFNTEGFAFKVNWGRNVGTELYNHTADPGENVNLAGSSGSNIKDLTARLSKLLHAGPTYGPASTKDATTRTTIDTTTKVVA